MALYNTYADAANTAVRAFLTEIGEYYLERSFNTGAGKAKNDWEIIRDENFSGEYAYCGRSDLKLQMEHLIMFNRTEFGLHHPGNIVPSCKNAIREVKRKRVHTILGKNTFRTFVHEIIKKRNVMTVGLELKSIFMKGNINTLN